MMGLTFSCHDDAQHVDHHAIIKINPNMGPVATELCRLVLAAAIGSRVSSASQLFRMFPSFSRFRAPKTHTPMMFSIKMQTAIPFGACGEAENSVFLDF